MTHPLLVKPSFAGRFDDHKGIAPRAWREKTEGCPDLGVEGLERFVRREPLRRVHECVFGVLALESEPVDPRLERLGVLQDEGG
jgi:hypothetical protein